MQVCAVRGNFDDAQTGVKAIFAEPARARTCHGAMLSICQLHQHRAGWRPRWSTTSGPTAIWCRPGRIQLGDKVDFAVPTGNFGDILAGYFAKRMGLPVGQLVCASNANDVLTEFLRTGVYDRRRPFHKTTSPSMDILVSSNLERLLYLLSEGDCGYVAGLMEQLNREGHYQVSPQLLERLQAEFDCACCDDAGAAEVIRRLWQEQHYLCDPHTAVAWSAAEQVRAGGRGSGDGALHGITLQVPGGGAGRAGRGGRDGDEFAMMERLHRPHRHRGAEESRRFAAAGRCAIRDVIDKDADAGLCCWARLSPSEELKGADYEHRLFGYGGGSGAGDLDRLR